MSGATVGGRTNVYFWPVTLLKKETLYQCLIFAVLYLTTMSGIVLFAFVGSDKDDDLTQRRS